MKNSIAERVPEQLEPESGRQARVVLRDARVLVTGVTGLIGGEIVRKLLGDETPRQIWCLARDRRELGAETRVLYRLGPAAAASSALSTVRGDILRGETLGMNQRDRKEVQGAVDLIIHCAAETSFIRDRACQDTNVEGTQAVLDFARQCERKPLVVYVGTAAGAGNRTDTVVREDDGCATERSHHNEYTFSKAMAESKVRDSGLEHLIVRPSIVLGDRLAHSELARQIFWFMPLLSEFEALPIDASSRLDIVPSSFVVDSILRLITHPGRTASCFNISAGEPFAMTAAAWASIADVYYRRSKPLRLIHPDQWDRAAHRRYIDTSRRRKIFAAFRHYLPFINMNVVFSNERLAHELGPFRIRPASEWIESLLAQIDVENALVESANP